jgi:hypothetical protein
MIQNNMEKNNGIMEAYHGERYSLPFLFHAGRLTRAPVPFKSRLLINVVYIKAGRIESKFALCVVMNIHNWLKGKA